MDGFTHITAGQDGSWTIHTERAGVEAHYEIEENDAHLLAGSLGVPIDRIPDGWRNRVPGVGPSATLKWLDENGVPYRTAFVWIEMED